MEYHCYRPVVVYQAIGSVFAFGRAVGQGDRHAHVGMGIRMTEIEPGVWSRRLCARTRQVVNLAAYVGKGTAWSEKHRPAAVRPDITEICIFRPQTCKRSRGEQTD